jgi:hypothetical protein
MGSELGGSAAGRSTGQIGPAARAVAGVCAVLLVVALVVVVWFAIIAGAPGGLEGTGEVWRGSEFCPLSSAHILVPIAALPCIALLAATLWITSALAFKGTSSRVGWIVPMFGAAVLAFALWFVLALPALPPCS